MKSSVFKIITVSLAFAMSQSVLAEGLTHQNSLIDWSKKVQASLNSRIDENLQLEMLKLNESKQNTEVASVTESVTEDSEQDLNEILLSQLSIK